METKAYSLADFGVTKKEGVLKNGLKVIFIEKPFAPIYAKIAMRAGAIFDPIGKAGLAHFTEHCIVGGSATHTKEELAGIIESVGGYKNASTDREYMTVQCEVAVLEHLSNVKEYFTQSLANMHLTEKLLEKEKGVISSEIQKSQSDTHTKSVEYAREIFANGSNWGTKVLGTIESISTFTIADIEEFFTTHCVVENMILVVAGGCTFEDVERVFEGIGFLHGEKHELPGPALPIAPQKITYIEDVPQTKIFFGFKGPDIGTREYFLFNFAINFAHQGLTSRFYKKIRNEKGLAYAISSLVWKFDTLQYLGTSVGIPTEKVQDTIAAIRECYTELTQEGISQKEIDDKIDTMWFSAKRTMQTVGDFVGAFVYDALFPEKDKEGIGSYPDIYNYRKTFTSAEIKEVLQKYINLDKVYLVISGREV